MSDKMIARDWALPAVILCLWVGVLAWNYCWSPSAKEAQKLATVRDQLDEAFNGGQPPWGKQWLRFVRVSDPLRSSRTDKCAWNPVPCVIVRAPSGYTDVDASSELPPRLRANTPREVRAVVVFAEAPEVVAHYTIPGNVWGTEEADAVRVDYKVWVIDTTTKRVIDRAILRGGTPPKLTAIGKGPREVRGPEPGIAAWLSKH